MVHRINLQRIVSAHKIILIIIILASISLIESAKILVVSPAPCVSHQAVFRALIQEMIKRDHEVTVITTDSVYPEGKSPINLNEINLHNLSYKLWVNWFKESAIIDQDDYLSKMTAAYRLLSEVFEEQLKDKTVQDLITNRTLKFDLLILEACVNPTLIFSHIFKSPVIRMSSFGANPGDMELIGAATHPFLYPMHYHRRIYNLTILEKANELYKDLLINQALKKQECEDDKMLKRIFGRDVPQLSVLKNNVDMLFLNVHPIWSHNQPVPSNVIYTWGITKKPESLLPMELQSYLDSSKNGVIYISFGTNVKSSSIPDETLKVLIEVFSRLPYNILWKWDVDELPGKSENIKISKWFPQSDLLRHPNVKLFITQGGLQSTEEALNAGIPLIGIPMIADQEYNTEKYEHFKIGIKLVFKSLNVEIFENAIKTIFSNYESYKKNIIKLRTQLQDQPKPPLENAIWWIEYILRHGGATHLRSPAANMPWTEYYEFELVFVLLCGFIIFVTLQLLLMYLCIKYVALSVRKNKVKKS